MRQAESRIYEFGDFRLDIEQRLLLQRDGKTVPLTPKVFETLIYLVQNNGKVLTKDELLTAIWTDTIVEENNLNQNISILRRVFGESRGENRYIVTVPGRGYKFVAPVQISSAKFQVSNLADPAPAVNQDDKIRNPQSAVRNRLWLVSLTVLSVFAVGAAGFYFWRGDATPILDEPIKTVAVLPFKPLVAENRNEALEFGMADTLINKLGGSRELTVRSINSVRKFGGLEQDALAAGRELKVDSILDGSIQMWGDRIRVSARFVRVSDGKQLWSGQFDEKFTDIFVVQDSISERVAANLRLQLDSDEKKRLTKRDTQNVEAYRLYLLGRYHSLKLTPSEIRKSLSYYQEAIDADPLYALAYTGQGYALATLPITSDVPPKDAFPKAKAAAERALAIDDSLPEAHRLLGWIHFWFDYDWVNAEKQMKRAIELNPNFADAHLGYAHFLSNMGRHDEALAEIKKARELDPLILIANALEGMFLFYAGREDEGINSLNKAFELDPNFWVARINLAKIYIHRRQFPEALVELEKAKQFSGGNSETVSLSGYALAKAGRREEALAKLAELEANSTQEYVPPYNIAMIHNGLDEREKSLVWLEKAFNERDVRMIFLKIDPKWNNLRDEPRFTDLMKRMNFE